MDSIPPEKQTILDQNTQYFLERKEHTIYTSGHTSTKIDITENNYAYQQDKKDIQLSVNKSENYQKHHLLHKNCWANLSPYCELVKDENLNHKPKQERYSDKTIYLFSDSKRVHNEPKFGDGGKLEGEQYNTKTITKLEKECDQNNIAKICHGKCNENCIHLSPNKKITYQGKTYEIACGSSYICQPIDCRKDTVQINDLVLKDNNLILHCKPRNYYEQQKIHKEPSVEEISSSCYIHPKTQQEFEIDNPNEETIRSEKSFLKQPISSKVDESDLLKQNNLVQSSSLFQELDNFKDLNLCENYEVAKVISCKKLSKKFKCSLWVLFYVNIFLVVLGLALCINTLAYLMSRNYINIVIEQTGFVMWVWVLMFVSVCIVIVGVYGIITSIDRGKNMLIVYSIAAFILAMLILIFLVFFWVMFENMKDVEHSSMINTFKKYRCLRYIRNAWDQLHETHKCCGVEDQRDWRFIPPSCCNATSKEQQVGCVTDVIESNQAFTGGCRAELEDFFAKFFFINAYLLIISFLLVLLGIFASLYLLKKYKKVVKCQEVCYISR